MFQTVGMVPRGSDQIAAAGTVALAVTGSAQAMTLPNFPSGPRLVRLVNAGNQVVHFVFGNLAVTTSGTALGIPILANTELIVEVPGSATQISAIAATTGSILYATVLGAGV